MRPGEITNTLGLKPLTSIFIGATTVSKCAFEQFVISVSHMFTPSNYNLLTWNCNHFSDMLCRFLVNRGIPKHILELPQRVQSKFAGRLFLSCLQVMQKQRQPRVTLDDAARVTTGDELPTTANSAAPTDDKAVRSSLCGIGGFYQQRVFAREMSTTDESGSDTSTEDEESWILPDANDRARKDFEQRELWDEESYDDGGNERVGDDEVLDDDSDSFSARVGVHKKQSPVFDAVMKPREASVLYIDIKGALPVGCSVPSPKYPKVPRATAMEVPSRLCLFPPIEILTSLDYSDGIGDIGDCMSSHRESVDQSLVFFSWPPSSRCASQDDAKQCEAIFECINASNLFTHTLNSRGTV